MGFLKDKINILTRRLWLSLFNVDPCPIFLADSSQNGSFFHLRTLFKNILALLMLLKFLTHVKEFIDRQTGRLGFGTNKLSSHCQDWIETVIRRDMNLQERFPYHSSQRSEVSLVVIYTHLTLCAHHKSYPLSSESHCHVSNVMYTC